MALTGGAMLIERSEGNLDRYLVVGITALEMMVAHLLSQLTALVYQVFVTMITAFVIFSLTIKGSYVLVIVLQLLTSLCGMCYGMLIFVYFVSNRHTCNLICNTYSWFGFIQLLEPHSSVVS